MPSTELNLYQNVHEQFRAAFGPPHHTLGKDDNWTLRASPQVPAVNVLLNGSRETPALWVFEPMGGDSVFKVLITHENQIGGLIKRIQERVAHTDASHKAADAAAVLK